MANERVQALCDQLYKRVKHEVPDWYLEACKNDAGYTQGEVLDAYCLCVSVLTSAIVEVVGGKEFKAALTDRVCKQIGLISKELNSDKRMH